MSLEKGQEFLIWYHQKNGKLRCQFEFFFSLSMIEIFFSLWLFLPDWPIWVVVVVFGICQDFFWVTLREIQTLSSLHPLLLLWLFQESLLLQTQVSLAKNTRENLLSVHILLNKILIKAARPASAQTRCLKIAENVSFNVASEASYVYILSWQKFSKNAENGQFWLFWKPEACGQTVLPDMSILIEQIGGKCQNWKKSNATFWVIFKTMWDDGARRRPLDYELYIQTYFKVTIII